jgi:hypothetical protein
MNETSENPYKRISQYISSIPKELLSDYKVPISDEFSDEIIPFDIYKNTQSNIERIADQINKAFYFKIYDGCFVLMRRLLETLLILSFIKLGIEDEIKDPDGSFLKLAKIINRAVSCKPLALTSNSKDNLKSPKVGGDLSAHNPYFCARQKDILNIRLQYRALIEELLHKAGIIK